MAMRSARVMVSCRNTWAYFCASPGCSASFLRLAMVSSISRSSRSMFSSGSMSWMERRSYLLGPLGSCGRQLYVASKLLDIGDRHGGHLFQSCDQIEIIAMARRAAVRDRRAMLDLTASQRRGRRRPNGRICCSSIGPVKPMGRVGLGRGRSTRTPIGMESNLDQQGASSLQGSPSERSFCASYVATVMPAVQLCGGSSRYSCRLAS
jgi:hypothetical protein